LNIETSKPSLCLVQILRIGLGSEKGKWFKGILFRKFCRQTRIYYISNKFKVILIVSKALIT
ncbi:hypothetical protein RPN13_07420, partial [Staphylococcus aureus]|nr:hypothetical protein [Staphylococcus aureus]